MILSQLIKDLDIINLSADVTGDVSTLCYAADKCEEGSLFVAISGLKHDGHDYIADAASCGARCENGPQRVLVSSIGALGETVGRRRGRRGSRRRRGGRLPWRGR